MEEKQRPKVGVGVMILKDGMVLLGKRQEDPKKSDSELHGEGTWTMPGGKLEFQETLKDGACREVFEETGIKIEKENLKIISVADDIIPDKHYVTVGFLCKSFEGDAKIMDPEEITIWKWYDLNNLPDKVFPPSARLIKAFLDNKTY